MNYRTRCENPHIIGRGDGSTLTYGYDALGRLTSEGQPFGSLTYAYDAAGDRTQITWAGIQGILVI